jgi:hypothetical protein
LMRDDGAESLTVLDAVLDAGVGEHDDGRRYSRCFLGGTCHAQQLRLRHGVYPRTLSWHGRAGEAMGGRTPPAAGTADTALDRRAERSGTGEGGDGEGGSGGGGVGGGGVTGGWHGG